ncbi:MAG: hypothetical protein ACOCRX_04200 [Candidatus Woesearchaeota archaeon]
MALKDWRKDGSDWFHKTENLHISIKKSGIRDISTGKPLYNVVLYDFSKKGLDMANFLAQYVTRSEASTIVKNYIKNN